MQVVGDVVAVVDTSVYPEYRINKGRVFLYALEMDAENGEIMDELEVIDEGDLVGHGGFKGEEVFIANSHIVYDYEKDTYRLYITEVSGGLFVVDFKHKLGRSDITIITINYLDIRDLLEKNNLHMPKDASVHAVSLSSYKYNPHFSM